MKKSWIGFAALALTGCNTFSAQTVITLEGKITNRDGTPFVYLCDETRSDGPGWVEQVDCPVLHTNFSYEVTCKDGSKVRDEISLDRIRFNNDTYGTEVHRSQIDRDGRFVISRSLDFIKRSDGVQTLKCQPAPGRSIKILNAQISATSLSDNPFKGPAAVRYTMPLQIKSFSVAEDGKSGKVSLELKRLRLVGKGTWE